MAVLTEILGFFFIIFFLTGSILALGIGVTHWWGHLTEEEKEMVMESMQINFMAGGK